LPNHTRKYDPEKDGEEKCIICNKGFLETENIAELNCGHIFHADCLKNMIQNDSIWDCPMCQAPIKNENNEFD
jgi:hypothetical protein